ncbi:hypothetical protein KYT87_09560 [Achromobacter sp. ES-001]|uniref:hypothetical protein n=1 Tax=Achromobacter sp. ES-001 TaxID=2860286 RepID=UPI001C63E42C|nr:hypothetical protein [Achromobacter sp. ES-001]QYJ23441.1 hypothetical protein KYT87_09560 [Achromobacter sp. ES-001]
MTTYNTGNPLGSVAVKDLYDNAENFDAALNDPVADSWVDRLGKVRQTWSGMERQFDGFMSTADGEFRGFMESSDEAFQQFLLSSGYQDLGDYSAGIQITSRNQIFRKDGELYRAGAALDLPYTTSGDWDEDGAYFLSVGDAALRQELAVASDSSGAALVGFLQEGDSAVLRSSQDKMRDIVSVKDFGALGVPISESVVPDETVLIQKALDASAGKVLVLAENRVYGITSISIPDNLTLFSNGSRFKKLAESETYAITGGLRLNADRLWLITVGGPTDTGINLSGGSMDIGEIRVESLAPNSGVSDSTVNGLLIGPASGAVARDKIGSIFISQFCRPIVFRNMRHAEIGFIQIFNYRRGVYVQNCQNCDFGDASITGISPTADGSPGDNGLLVESTIAGGTVDIAIGNWYIEDPMEHGIRLGGLLPIRGFWAARCHILRPGYGSVGHGGSGFKVQGSSSDSYHYNIFVDDLIVEDGNPGGGNFCGVHYVLVSGGHINNVIIRNRNNPVSTFDGLSFLSCQNVQVNNPTVINAGRYGARLYTGVSAGLPDGLNDVVINGGLLDTTSNSPVVKFEGDSGPIDQAFVRCGVRGTTLRRGNRAVEATALAGAGALTDCFAEFSYFNGVGGAITEGTGSLLMNIIANAFTDTTPARDGSTFQAQGSRVYTKEFGKWQSPTLSFTMTIADDTAISWTPPRAHQHVFVSLASNSQYGQAWVRQTPTPNAVKVSGGAAFATLASALSGTTGTDGNVTLGASGGLMYLENRSGNSQSFTVTQLG